MEVLERKEIFTPSPIQDLCYTEIKKDQYRNFVLVAPTGTGKTLAYSLPILNTLKEEEEAAGKIYIHI